MLPTNIVDLREAVRQSAHMALNRAGSREELVRVFEIVAAESRLAGIRAALESIEEARKAAPMPELPHSSPMYLYAQGYDHALRDASELLTCTIG